MTLLSHSNRLLYGWLALVSCLDSHAAGQVAPTVSFRVFTEPAGAKFAVDGIIYTSAATFQWPMGSKHFVKYVQDSVPTVPSLGTDPTALTVLQYTQDGASAYAFQSWADNNGLLTAGSDPNQVVTADPKVTYLKATVQVQYRIILDFLNSPTSTTTSTCGAPGTPALNTLAVGVVYIAAQCYASSAIIYLPGNQKLLLNAFPFPGFVFLGWSNIGTDAYLTSLTLLGPMTLAPRFSPAKRVRFETQPLGLQVLVDRTSTPTVSSTDPNSPCPHNEGLPVTVPSTVPALCRGDFDFAPGSSHLVGAISPQTDLTGKSWVFGSWGAGHGENDVYTADMNTTSGDTVLVKFIPAARASFVTSPPGLKLSVDGRSNWPAYNFIWGLGTVHQVSAPPQQVDPSGRKYTFRGWSNGGDASQTVTVDQSSLDAGFRIIASFDVLSRVVVQTSPSGQTIQVDGNDCTSPCIVDRANGTALRVTAPVSVSISDGARLDLASWSDGGSADHTFTIKSDLQILTANYQALYRLTTSSDPANGASFQVTPASPDMFYQADSVLTVATRDNPGFKFRRWGGDLTGTYAGSNVSMSGPRSAIALMDRVPYIAPAGVKNAGGDTPESFVAAGSLISITGESLAPDTSTGRVNPLAQTLGGVTVTLADRFLPLVSVSPQSVVAQLPSDLAEGEYTLQVHLQGQQDVSASFTVKRDAPGLFSTALHPDGTAITSDNPAAIGETITILGTGFGPYTAPVIDGFFPISPAPSISDSVDVMAADQVFQPVSCAAAEGYTGMVALKLTMTDALVQAAKSGMKVRVNGVLSNSVVIPTQQP